MVAKIIQFDNSASGGIQPPNGSGTFLSRDGVRIYFEDSGGAGPCLFFVYGLGCTIDHWRHQREFFSRAKIRSQSYRQIWLDYRGQGKSERPPKGHPLTMDMIANDMMDLCSLRDIKKVVILGQSMGGCLAIRVAERAPDLVASMVLLASPSEDPALELPFQPVSPWIWRATIGLNDRLPSLARGLYSLVTKARQSEVTYPKAVQVAIREFIRYQGFNADLAKTSDIENYIDQVFSVPTDLFLEMAGDLEQFDIAKIDPPIQTPTLIVAGEEDRVVPIATAHKLNKYLPNSRLEIIPHGSHCPHIDDPTRINRLLEKFLSDL
jgi:pimeloyl-ACP methyl ester carboxylesterase